MNLRPILLTIPLLLTSCTPTPDDANRGDSRSAPASDQADQAATKQADQAASKQASPSSIDDRYPPAPELPPAPDAIRIAVISDINASYGTIGYAPTVRAAVDDIIRRQVHIVVSPGDLVAGQKPNLPYDAMWRAFHYQIGDVFFDNNIDFIMAPGNHDASAYPQHATERDAYARAFQNRQPRATMLPGSAFPFYYAVTTRDILIIALDITRPIRDDDPQLDWLQTTLTQAKSARATLVLGHLPLSPINFNQFFEIASSPRLRQLLQAAPRTIYISGHHHIYYPGHIGELRTISAPALGSGPRSLFGAPPTNAYALITIPPSAPPTVTALVAPNFKRMIDHKSLPTRILQTEREDIGIAEFIIESLDNSVTIPAI